MSLNRRQFLQLGAATGALAYLGGRTIYAKELDKGGRSPSATGKARQAIPSSCFQCTTVCGIIGFVEDGRLVKIEGNPAHPNNKGLICAKGQAGVNQLYDAQRVLYPMKQTKERGDRTGWKRISWDEALDEVAGRLKKLREEGRPEQFVVIPGRDRTNGYLNLFTQAYGTPNQFGRGGTCSNSKKEGFEEAFGYESHVAHITESRYALNFGCGVLESTGVFVPNAQRAIKAISSGQCHFVTFDPRLSNTAAKSSEWISVKPASDLAVALAMHYVIIKENLVDPKMVKWFNYPLDKYLAHLEKEGYTPEWAEKMSGVPAATITRIAREWATIKPGTLYAYKGIGTHYNGAMTAKAILLLAALVGNLNVPGGVLYNNKPNFKYPKTPPALTKKKSAVGKSGPTSKDASTQILKLYAEGKDKIDTFMTFVHNPVYVLGDAQLHINILKDRTKIPYFVALDTFFSESAALADIILPDTTYLERWDPETHYPLDAKAWVAIRQPIVKPMGESMPERQILQELAKRIGGGMEQFFNDHTEESMIAANVKDCLPGFEAWGGFEKLKQVGAYYNPDEKPPQFGYADKEVTDLKDTEVDEKTNLVYKLKDGKRGDAIGIKLSDGKVYKGWKTKHKMIGLWSQRWADANQPGLPTWIPSPKTTNLKPDELVLIQYKFPTLAHSRTSNCKWLSEITHDNPIWINPATAAKYGLKEGDKIKIKSKVNEKVANIRITEGIRPDTLASGWGPGHWEYGAFATAGKSLTDPTGKAIGGELQKADRDYGRIWWTENGTLSNWWPEILTDPIGGGQEWATPVTISKA
ncbi:MAG TPA: molybdopterin-dependent oxidoreductase [Symbiobacteriaceae bacterium]|nr:molybdopterin-dependent oxidoreductase [Symbiobacteriaceae bacterium]